MRNQNVHSETHSRKADRPRGMTLIELLVVITILTTLVAGVIPLLSPNNDPRKIREASREVQNYITLAQAEAARTGRPHGIFLQKLSATTGIPGDPTNPDRGVCLEIFQIEEPPAFAGFSENSAVRIYPDVSLGTPILRAQFGIGLNSTFTSGSPNGPSLLELPQRMFRPGDILEVDGNRYRLSRELDAPTDRSDLDGPFFIATNGPTNNSPDGDGFRVEWLNNNGQVVNDTIGNRYAIRRLPMRSAEPPLQLPKGVCIDLQCSGLPVDQMPSCCHNPLIAIDENDPMLTN
ncbi:MAG: type II secretion system protein, partial [Lacipirellulaceae bacterium]